MLKTPPPLESNRKSDERTKFIELGLPIVRRAAFRLARRLPPNVDVGDLIGAGTEGLLKAIEDYDPSRANRFETYAEIRIRGAILDELRASDHLTRYGRQRFGEVSKAIRELEQNLGRAPSEEEIAHALGLSIEAYGRLAENLARGPALGRLGEIDPDHVASDDADPATLYQDAELRQILIEAIARLPERTQTVLGLYYQEECTQAEIGEILGITESRVCQILGDSFARLQALLSQKGRGLTQKKTTERTAKPSVPPL